MKLAPAILVKNQEQYSAELAIVEKIADRYQFDFIDGEFVNNQSLDLDKIKSNDLIVEYFGEIYQTWYWYERQDILK